MEEIRQRIEAENRLMSPVEQAQMVAYGRAALRCMVEDVLGEALEKIEADLKAGNLNRHQIQMIDRMAREGIPLAHNLQQRLKNNLSLRTPR